VVKIPDKYIDFFSLKTILILFVSGGLFITLFFFPLFRNSDMSQVMLSILFNGLLTVGLGIVNGVIAEQVKISWLEQPIKRFIVSFVLTIIATIVVAALVQLLLRYSHLRRTSLRSFIPDQHGILLQRIADHAGDQHFFAWSELSPGLAQVY
jgi:ABC-type branched-subunit amino acid transport system permease subunit